jgi:hypothetical protein
MRQTFVESEVVGTIADLVTAMQDALNEGKQILPDFRYSSWGEAYTLLSGQHRKIDRLEDPAHWIKLAGMSLAVPDDTLNFLGLQAAVQAVGGDLANVTVSHYGQNRTVNRAASQATEWDVASLEVQGPVRFGKPLTHADGVSLTELRNQIRTGLDYMENLAGVRPKIMAWPQHRHSAISLKIAREEGIIMCRDGTTWVEPVSGWIETGTPAKYEHWATCPYVIPLHDWLLTANLSGVVSEAQMLIDLSANYLNDLYTNNMWGQFYLHGNNQPVAGDDLTATELGWLLNLISSDPLIWTDTFGNIAQYVVDTHDLNNNIYVPKAGALPWKGKSAAFSFSYDDIKSEVYTDYFPKHVLHNVPFTLFVDPTNIIDNGGAEVTIAQIKEMLDSGLCELGCHGYGGERLIDENACAFHGGPSGETLGVEVVDDGGGDRSLHFYVGKSGEYPKEVISQANCWLKGNDLLANLKHGDEITSWVDRASGYTLTGQGTTKPLVVGGARSFQAAAGFAGVDEYFSNLSDYGDMWSNTNGFMVFAVLKYLTSANRHICSQFRTAGAGRCWTIEIDHWRVCEDAAADLPVGVNPVGAGHFASGSWHTMGMLWQPGSAVQGWADGSLSVAGANAVNNIETGLTVPFEVGAMRTGFAVLHGEIAEVVTFPLYDLAIARRMMGYLHREYGISWR